MDLHDEPFLTALADICHALKCIVVFGQLINTNVITGLLNDSIVEKFKAHKSFRSGSEVHVQCQTFKD